MRTEMRKIVHRAIVLVALVVAWFDAIAAPRNAAPNPIATPMGMVRFYLHALGTGQCDLAYKFSGLAFGVRPMGVRI
jgi:hypothetical protein